MSRPGRSPLAEGVELFDVYLSDKCNLDCRYCFARKEHASALSLDEVLRGFSQAKAALGNDFRVIFLGGEPLLDPALLEKAAAGIARRGAHPVTVYTNGTLLAPDVFRRLAALGCKFSVSLDGGKRDNDRNRYFRDSGASVFDSVVGNLRRVPPRRRGLVELKMVLRPETSGSLEKNFAFFKSLGYTADHTSDCFCAWTPAEIKRYGRAELGLQRRYVSAFARSRAALPASLFNGLSKYLNPDWWRRCNKLILGWDGVYYPCYALLKSPAAERLKFAAGDLRRGPDMARRAAWHAEAVAFVDAAAPGAKFSNCPMGAYFQNMADKAEAAAHVRRYAALSDAQGRAMLRGLAPISSSAAFRSALPVSVRFLGKEIRALEVPAEAASEKELPATLRYLLNTKGPRKELLLSGVDPSRDGGRAELLARRAFAAARLAGKQLWFCAAAAAWPASPGPAWRRLAEAGAVFSAPCGPGFFPERPGWVPAGQWRVQVPLSPGLAAARGALASLGPRAAFARLEPDLAAPWTRADLRDLGLQLRAIGRDCLAKMAAGGGYYIHGAVPGPGSPSDAAPDGRCFFTGGLRLAADGAFLAGAGPGVNSSGLLRAGGWARGFSRVYRDCSFSASSPACAACRRRLLAPLPPGAAAAAEMFEVFLRGLPGLLAGGRGYTGYLEGALAGEALLELPGAPARRAFRR